MENLTIPRQILHPLVTFIVIGSRNNRKLDNSLTCLSEDSSLLFLVFKGSRWWETKRFQSAGYREFEPMAGGGGGWGNNVWSFIVHALRDNRSEIWQNGIFSQKDRSTRKMRQLRATSSILVTPDLGLSQQVPDRVTSNIKLQVHIFRWNGWQNGFPSGSLCTVSNDEIFQGVVQFVYALFV